jgi:fluoride exporter
MQKLIAIGVGGCLGALARHGLNELIHRRFPHFPWATLSANLIGCLLIGVVMALVIDGRYNSEIGISLISIGFLGSLTTFSTFSLQTLELMQEDRLAAAGANILSNVAVGLMAVWVGMKLARLA